MLTLTLAARQILDRQWRKACTFYTLRVFDQRIGKYVEDTFIYPWN